MIFHFPWVWVHSGQSKPVKSKIIQCTLKNIFSQTKPDKPCSKKIRRDLPSAQPAYGPSNISSPLLKRIPADRFKPKLICLSALPMNFWA